MAEGIGILPDKSTFGELNEELAKRPTGTQADSALTKMDSLVAGVNARPTSDQAAAIADTLSADAASRKEQTERVIAALEKAASALGGIEANTEGEMTMEKLVSLIKAGEAPNKLNLGDELTFSESPSLATAIVGTLSTTEGASAGTTVDFNTGFDLATFTAKEGTTSAHTRTFVYYGSAWHLETATGATAVLSEYGITAGGTPADYDYITIALSSSSFVMQVAGFDHYGNKEGQEHSLTLITKDLVRNGQQFSTPPEMAFAVTKKAMPAGKYKIRTSRDELTQYGNAGPKPSTYTFSTTVEVPVGGGLYVNNQGWTGTNVAITQIVSYSSDRATALETITAITEEDASDATLLGDLDCGFDGGIDTSQDDWENEYGLMNYGFRAAYGDNNWAVSIYRQWLNSDKAKGQWWEPKTCFQLKPSNGWTDQVDGFLYGLDPELKNALLKTKNKYSMGNSDFGRLGGSASNTSKPSQWVDDSSVSVSGRIVTCEDYLFAPSFTELFGESRDWYDASIDPVLPLYEGLGNGNSGLIKSYGGTAARYWTRCPAPYTCDDSGLVEPSGHANNAGVYWGLGVAFVCSVGADRDVI